MADYAELLAQTLPSLRPGDCVWYIDSSVDTMIQCEHCGQKRYPWKVRGPKIIRELIVRITQYEHYSPSCDWWAEMSPRHNNMVAACHVFASREEAQAACDQRNHTGVR